MVETMFAQHENNMLGIFQGMLNWHEENVKEDVINFIKGRSTNIMNELNKGNSRVSYPNMDNDLPLRDANSHTMLWQSIYYDP